MSIMEQSLELIARVHRESGEEPKSLRFGSRAWKRLLVEVRDIAHRRVFGSGLDASIRGVPIMEDAILDPDVIVALPRHHFIYPAGVS